jgi:hypothetical protein
MLRYDHGDPTDDEQLMLELVNRARMDPYAEIALYGIVDLNEGLSPGTIAEGAKQPLALNRFLIDSSRQHSQWMLDNDVFSHSGINGTTSTQRMTAAGYSFVPSYASGENLAWYGTTASSIDLDATTEINHEGLMNSPGHRENILYDGFREIGIGNVQGYFFTDGIDYNSLMTTENFAFSASSPDTSNDGFFITGVVFEDFDNDGAYDPGEGLGDCSVVPQSGSFYGQSSISGGYAIPMAAYAGASMLTVSGDSLPVPMTQTFSMTGNANIKVDFRYREVLSGVLGDTLIQDGWRMSSWLGFYYFIEPAWIYSVKIGWGYVYPSGDDSMYFWDLDHGWFWTSSTFYPWFYSYELANWIKFDVASAVDNRRWAIWQGAALGPWLSDDQF